MTAEVAEILRGETAQQVEVDDNAGLFCRFVGCFLVCHESIQRLSAQILTG